MAVQGGHGLFLGGLDLSLALVGGGVIDRLDVAGRDLEDDVLHAGGDALFAIVRGHGGEVVVGLFELLHGAVEVVAVGFDVDGGGVIKNNLGGGDEGLARRGHRVGRGRAVLLGCGEEKQRCGEECCSVHGIFLSGHLFARRSSWACAI